MKLRFLDRKNRLLLPRKGLQLLICAREDLLSKEERPCYRDLPAAEAATGKSGSHASSCSGLVTFRQCGNEQGQRSLPFPVSCIAQRASVD